MGYVKGHLVLLKREKPADRPGQPCRWYGVCEHAGCGWESERFARRWQALNVIANHNWVEPKERSDSKV